MNVAGTGTSTSAASYTSAATPFVGKDDFLKLLLAQLANQDPLSPMQDKEFVAQMAQFSSLEQLQNLGKSMEGLVDAQVRGSVISQATSLIGKEVTIQVVTGKDAEGNPVYGSVSGHVAKVKLVEGWPTLVVDGKEYQLSDVVEVA